MSQRELPRHGGRYCLATTSVITNADDDVLVSRIGAARLQLTIAAPGISLRVAAVVATAWRRLGADACTVVLDADPEVFRLGYGEIAALKLLHETATELGALVCHHPGLRIGLLVTDGRVLAFSPTPLLIEAGAHAPLRPNAVALEDVPVALAAALGIGTGGVRERSVGLDSLQTPLVQETEAALREAPPVRFDLARRVRVFTARFQFVEFEMKGCFISRMKVPIPASLVGLAQKRDVERQFHAQFDLIGDGDLTVVTGVRPITEKALREERKEIEEKFLVSIPGFGVAVLRSNKSQLDAAVDALRVRVQQFAKGVRAQLCERIADRRATVVDALLPAVAASPPDAFTKQLGPSPSREAVRRMLDLEIEDAFGSVERLVGAMEVRIVYKDVAYESLTDPRFIEAARKGLPTLDALHQEFDAAAGDPQQEDT